jgi:hypothetical protein
MRSVEQSVEWELAGETEVLGGNRPSATLSTTNPTWPDLGSNPGSRGGKPVTNRLSYGTAWKPTIYLISQLTVAQLLKKFPVFYRIRTLITGRIWGSHGGGYEEIYHLGHNTV